MRTIVLLFLLSSCEITFRVGTMIRSIRFDKTEQIPDAYYAIRNRSGDLTRGVDVSRARVYPVFRPSERFDFM